MSAPVVLSEIPIPSEADFLTAQAPFITSLTPCITKSPLPPPPSTKPTKENPSRPYSCTMTLPHSIVVPQVLLVDKELSPASFKTIQSTEETGLVITVEATTAKALRTSVRGVMDMYCVTMRGVVEFGGASDGASDAMIED